MSRPLRIELPGGFYHVMSHGNGRQWLYRTEKQLELFLHCLSDIIRKYHVLIHAAVLMRNHYHLLVETPEGNLSACMKRFNSEFSRLLNRQLGRRGSVLQKRYKAVLVDEDEYYLSLLRYIYQNPVRAGIIRNAEEYQGSGLSWYGDKKKEDVICWKDLKLSYCSQRNWYKKLVEYIDADKEPDPYKDKAHPSMIGSREWAEKIKGMKVVRKVEGSNGEGKYQRIGFKEKKLSELLKNLEGKDRKAAEILFRYRYSGMTVREIMEKTGKKTYFSVTQSMYRLKKRIEGDGRLRRKMEDIEKRIGYG
jgi:putative transposase